MPTRRVSAGCSAFRTTVLAAPSFACGGAPPIAEVKTRLRNSCNCALRIAFRWILILCVSSPPFPPLLSLYRVVLGSRIQGLVNDIVVIFFIYIVTCPVSVLRRSEIIEISVVALSCLPLLREGASFGALEYLPDDVRVPRSSLDSLPQPLASSPFLLRAVDLLRQLGNSPVSLLTRGNASF